MLVTVITPSNAAIFPEYILPNIKHIVLDPEVSVRCTYAQCIVQIANAAVRYLEMGQALKAHGAFKSSPDAQEYGGAHYEVSPSIVGDGSVVLIFCVSKISYDANMQDLQNIIQEHLATLLMDQSSIVKRAVLHDISSICIFLGRQRTNDVLLSHMITYLNDKDWLLRYAFFESIVDVAACAGGRSLEEYILPLMVQALSGNMNKSYYFQDSFGRRCGRERRCTGAGCADKPMRARPTPKDEDMGTYECYARFPLSSEYLDTTRHSRVHIGSCCTLTLQRCMVHPLSIPAPFPQIGCGNNYRAKLAEHDEATGMVPFRL